MENFAWGKEGKTLSPAIEEGMPEVRVLRPQ